MDEKDKESDDQKDETSSKASDKSSSSSLCLSNPPMLDNNYRFDTSEQVLLEFTLVIPWEVVDVTRTFLGYMFNPKVTL